MLKIAVVMLALLGLGTLVVSCNRGEAGLTKLKFDAVKTGMTADEVKTILGEPSQTESSGEKVLGVGGSSKTMVWKQGDKSISVEFVNDKVLKKSFLNLD